MRGKKNLTVPAVATRQGAAGAIGGPTISVASPSGISRRGTGGRFGAR